MVDIGGLFTIVKSGRIQSGYSVCVDLRPFRHFSRSIQFIFVVTCLLAKPGGGELVERIASSDPISDTLPAALPETGSVDVESGG